MAINQSICHYKKSNYIKNMKDLWVSDIKTHNDMIYKYESKMIKNETTYKELFNKYFKNYYKIDIYKIDEYISPKDSKNENTIIAFNWDIGSPILNDDFDKNNIKFKKLKELLKIMNEESRTLEDHRSNSRNVYIPPTTFTGSNKDLLKVDEKYFFCRGDAILMHNRPRAKLGFLINMVSNQNSIEFSNTQQSKLENFLNPELSYGSNQVDYFTELKSDTMESRRKCLVLAFNELMEKILAINADEEQENKHIKIYHLL